MPIRRRGNTLERWEIALIKAMIKSGRWPNDQDILAHFTRPTRSINHRVISEIRTGAKHAAVKKAEQEELDAFLATWPEVDPETGLTLRGDELLIKAREAMIAAVHIFNSAGLTFRAELFIVTAIIAWTYLLHAWYRRVRLVSARAWYRRVRLVSARAWYRREGIDYRHCENKNGQQIIVKTKQDADKYWELSQCLKHIRCPVEQGAKDNLAFLIELRHEIEHRSTNRVDDAVGAKLQACCINFNNLLKEQFGTQYGLECRLPIALQFVTFSPEQRALLKRAGGLPRHIETMMNDFHNHLTPEQQADPRFAYRVAFIQKTANRASSADEAIEFVKPGSEEAAEINRILLKEVEKRKYLPSEVVAAMRAEG